MEDSCSFIQVNSFLSHDLMSGSDTMHVLKVVY